MLSSSSVDACKVYGVIYIEESKSKADHVIFEEESEAFADLTVFEEENSLYADRVGIWHFTEDPSFADYKVYFTKNNREADFSVAYTETESFAGCNN